MLIKKYLSVICIIFCFISTVIAGPNPYYVFSGGGIKGIAYVGALAASNLAQSTDKDINKAINTPINVDGAIGASAGSFVALAAVLSMTPQEIADFLIKIDWSSFQNGMSKADLYNLLYQKNRSWADYIKQLMKSSTAAINEFGNLSSYGYNDNKALRSTITALLATKSKSPDYTFADLWKDDHKALYVVSYNVSNNETFVFGKDTTPNIAIRDAITASGAIPFFFSAAFFQKDQTGALKYVNTPLQFFSKTYHDIPAFGQYTNDIGEKVFAIEPFVDGGTVNNYPLDIIKNKEAQADDRIKGFMLLTKDEIKWLKTGNIKKGFNKHIGVGNVATYASMLFGGLLDLQYAKYAGDKDFIKKTTMIDTLNFSATDFDKMKDIKNVKQLIMQGCYAQLPDTSTETCLLIADALLKKHGSNLSHCRYQCSTNNATAACQYQCQ